MRFRKDENGQKKLVAGKFGLDLALSRTSKHGVQNKVITAEFDNVNAKINDKIDTDSGEFEDTSSNTYIGKTVDMISFDETNNQLLLKVDGADTVYPFKKGIEVMEQSRTMYIRSAAPSVTFSFPHGILGIKSMSNMSGVYSITVSGNTISCGYGGNDRDASVVCIGY